MPYKVYSVKIFTLPDGYTISCRSERTRYGFRHLATLFKDGYQVERYKACYYNRTWESYEFQTVVHGVLGKYYYDNEPTQIALCEMLDKQSLGEIDQMFKTIGTIAKLGEIFTNNKVDSNKWKERMLKAGLSGLDFPENFDSLSEEEKEKRLNKVIEFTQGKDSK